MKKIFITGSTGFLGRNIVNFYSSKYSLKKYLRGDDLEKSLNDFKPDLIIHSAAELYNKNLMFESNVLLTKELCEYVKNNSNCSMIHIGSGSEYGYVPRPSNENDMIKPHDLYSATKGMSTIMCQGYAKSYNLDIVIVRPYSPYGQGEQPHRLFPSLWKSFKLNTPMILKNGVHDFLYVDDFVNGLDVIVHSEKREPGEIINLSSGQQYSNLAVYEKFKSITGISGTVTIVNEMTTWDTWCADISYVEKKYGWTPRYSLEEGIILFLEKSSC